MPRRCVVPNCSSNCQNYKKNDKSSYVSTFLFPANEEKLNLWLKLINTACNSDIKEVTKCSGICIKHFEDQYILTEASAVRPDGSVLTVPLKRTRLSPDAIPTIFVEEKDFVNTKAAKRKFVKDQNKRVSTSKKKEQEDKTSAVALIKDETQRKKPRQKTANVFGTYIIRAEIIKPGPRLIFDESVSRIEREEKDKQEHQDDTLQEEFQNVDNDLQVVEEESNYL